MRFLDSAKETRVFYSAPWGLRRSCTLFSRWHQLKKRNRVQLELSADLKAVTVSEEYRRNRFLKQGRFIT